MFTRTSLPTLLIATLLVAQSPLLSPVPTAEAFSPTSFFQSLSSVFGVEQVKRAWGNVFGSVPAESQVGQMSSATSSPSPNTASEANEYDFEVYRNVPYCIEDEDLAPLITSNSTDAFGNPIDIVADPTHPGNRYVDVYVPISDISEHENTPFPTVVFTHGGGGIKGDKSDVSNVDIVELLVKKGYVVYNVNYPLGDIDNPEDSIRAVEQLSITQCSVRFAKAMASKFNNNPSDVTLVGNSWGAAFSLSMAFLANNDYPWEPLNYYPNYNTAVNSVINLWGTAYLDFPSELSQIKESLEEKCNMLKDGRLQDACLNITAIQDKQKVARYGVMPNEDCSNVTDGFSDNFPFPLESLRSHVVPNGCVAFIGSYYMDNNDDFEVLTIQGDQDIFVDIDGAVALEGDIHDLPGYSGKMTTIVFPGSNHGVMDHLPDVYEIISDWVDEKSGERSLDTLPSSALYYSDWVQLKSSTEVSAQDTTKTPSVTLTANQNSLTVGQTTVLSWTSANTTSCMGTGFSSGGKTSGSVTLSPTTNTTYTLACTGAGGTVSTSTTVSVTTPPPSTSATLLSYAFNQTSGTSVTDTSGNKRNGTLSGATWSTSGKFGSALSFDGVNDSASTPSFTSSPTAVTYEYWVYAPNVTQTSYARTIQTGTATTRPTVGFSHEINPAGAGNNKLKVVYWSGTTATSIGTLTLTTNAWNHIAHVMNGNSATVYLNGSPVFSKTAPRGIGSAPLTMGAGSKVYFKGRIDNLRIHPKALTQTEVKSMMNASN